MPSLIEKIKILGAAGKYDICASSGCSAGYKGQRKQNRLFKKNSPLTNDQLYIGSSQANGICHSFTPDGRCISLFKVLFSNSCVFNCKYCFNRVNKRKMALTPEEYARAFMNLYLGNYVEGMFLSSGISSNADFIMEKMLEAVILLREKYNFRGYIHFKCLPGASKAIIDEAAYYVDRMSVNLEAPSPSHLSEIASQKNMKSDIIQRQKWIDELSKKPFDDWEKIDNIQQYDGLSLGNLQDCDSKYKNAKRIPAGQTTQFVVGAADETDLDILNTLYWEYKNVNLRRGYFSAFQPIEGTPLETKSATPLLREHRLYNMDWLMRVYKIPFLELKSVLREDDNNLPREDPKISLARNYFGGLKAQDINSLKYGELLRIPGIGMISAKRIIKLRSSGVRISNKRQLKNVGVVLKRAEPFIKLGGKYQSVLDRYM